MASFKQDKVKGDIGEAYVKELMEARGHEVKDYTAVPTYWKKDVDFNIAGFDVEVKTDMRIAYTGNLFIEDYIEYTDGGWSDGWFRFTEAQYLFYLDGVTKTLYIYEIKKLKEYIKNNSIRKVQARDLYQMREGYLLPAFAVDCQVIRKVA